MLYCGEVLACPREKTANAGGGVEGTESMASAEKGCIRRRDGSRG